MQKTHTLTCTGTTTVYLYIFFKVVVVVKGIKMTILIAGRLLKCVCVVVANTSIPFNATLRAKCHSIFILWLSVVEEA